MSNFNRGIELGPARRARGTRTAILGIGFAMVQMKRSVVPHFMANCGPVSRKFNIQTLGRAEAFRRALKARAAYETAWAQRRAA
jgi:hypothetical protein